MSSQETVITHDDLLWMIESTSLTILNDRILYEEAEKSLKKYGHIATVTTLSAMRASGDGLYEKFMKLNKLVAHKVMIRHKIGHEVAKHMDMKYRKKISDEAILSIAGYYRPTVDWSGLERRVCNHLTVNAFNELTDDEKVNWLNSATYAKPFPSTPIKGHVHAGDFYSGEPTEYVKCSNVEGVKYFEEAKGTRPDKIICDDVTVGVAAEVRDELLKEIMEHMDKAQEHFNTVEGKLPDNMKQARYALMYGASEEDIISILTKPENPIMDTTKPARNLTEVFGNIITGMSKDAIMEMIRVAQKDVDGFADLDQDSAFVKKQIKSLKDGIKKLYAELDK